MNDLLNHLHSTPIQSSHRSATGPLEGTDPAKTRDEEGISPDRFIQSYRGFQKSLPDLLLQPPTLRDRDPRSSLNQDHCSRVLVFLVPRLQRKATSLYGAMLTLMFPLPPGTSSGSLAKNFTPLHRNTVYPTATSNRCPVLA